MKPIQAALRVLLGLVIIVLSFIVVVFIGTESPVHDFALLKWVPVLIVIIGYGLAGWVTRRVPLAWLLLLLTGLLVFMPMDFFYFPFLIVLMAVALFMLAASRPEFGKAFNRVGVLLSIGIFAYYLFSQPLIIYEERHGVTNYGDLVGARALWGTYGGERQLPEISFRDLEGASFSTAEWQGKQVYVTFWATWCGPCIAKMPELEAFKARHRENEDILFVDVSLDEDQEAWENFLHKRELSGLQLISPSPDRTRHLIGIDGLPDNILVDPQGRYVSGITLEGAQELIELPDDELDEFMRLENRIMQLTGQEGD